MNDGVYEKDLLQLIENCMNIQDVQSYEKTKIQLILKFFEENNINTLDNITCIGTGTYSTVFKVNKFVIKIGLAKARKKIIESPNVAKEFIRLNIKFVTSKMTIVIGFEIQLFVQKYEKKSEEDLYQLYCSLRKENLIWTDVKYENVGILNDKLVVLDVDDIFYNNDSNIHWITPLSIAFEEKYEKKERSVWYISYEKKIWKKTK